MPVARLSRLDVYQAFQRARFIPVFSHADLAQSLRIVDCVYEAGVRVFEWTHRGPAAFENFVAIQKHCEAKYSDLILGVGSILDSETASRYREAQASFIVSPTLSESLAHYCNRYKLAWLPGCGTLSEIQRAHELGAEIVKIFPANHFDGPRFIKSIRGPMPWISAMPTGGIEPTRESMKTWLDAGVVCFGVGSSLFYEAGELRSIVALKELVSNALAFCEQYRD